MEFVWQVVEETPIVPLARYATLQMIAKLLVSVRMVVTSTMIVHWVQPVLMGTAQIHVLALMNVDPMPSVKQFHIRQHANAQRAPVSSILLM